MYPGKAEAFRPRTGNNLMAQLKLTLRRRSNANKILAHVADDPESSSHGISESPCKFPNHNPKRWRKRHYLITLNFCVAQRICSLVSEELLEALWKYRRRSWSATPAEPPQNASMHAMHSPEYSYIDDISIE